MVDSFGGNLITLPAWSVVSIDRNERFLYFSVFEDRQIAQTLVLVDLSYTADFSRQRKAKTSSTDGSSTEKSPESESGNVFSTRGFLFHLLKTIENLASGSNLRRVSNKLVDQSTTREQGTVRLFLEIQQDPKEADPHIALETMIDKLRNAILALEKPEDGRYELRLNEVRVGYYPSHRIFVSMIQDFSRRPDVVRLLESISKAKGLEVVIVGADAKGMAGRRLYESSITDTVLRQLRECDGFLQLLTLRPDERDALRRGEQVHPNYGWLAYEYGVADERDLGPIRVVDAIMPPDVLRAFGVRQDNLPLKFDTEGSEELLRQQLERAIEAVEEHLYQRSPLATSLR